MPLTQFKEEFTTQAEADAHELVTHLEAIVGRKVEPETLEALRHTLEQSWMAGAIWGIKEGSDRAHSMVYIIAEEAMNDMRAKLAEAEKRAAFEQSEKGATTTAGGGSVPA